MKFSINTKYFLHILKAIDRIIDKRSTVPVLQYVYFKTDGNILTVTGTNPSMSINLKLTPTSTNQLNVQGKDKRGILVKSYFLKQIVNNFSAKMVSLSSSKNDDFTVLVTSGKSRFKIHYIKGTNFPHLPKYKTADMVTLPSQKLIQMIKRISINASEEESRPILTGVELTAHDGRLTAVATDSHRLGREVATIKNDKADFAVDIPAKNLQELTRLIKKTQNVQVVTTPEASQIVFQANHLTFYSRLLFGNYPQIDGLFKRQYHSTMKTNAQQLMDTVQRASLIAHASRDIIVNLRLDPKGRIELDGNSQEVGHSQEEMAVKATGKPVKLAFNPDYLVEALKTLKNQTVEIRFDNPLTPMEVTADQDHDKRFTQLITPVRVF